MLSSTIRIMDIESGVDVYTLQLGAPTSLARCSATQVKQCLCHTFTLIAFLHQAPPPPPHPTPMKKERNPTTLQQQTNEQQK